jgi:DNA-binding CsgD family transcriptional regulator
MSWEPRTGNPGGRGTPSSRADIQGRLEDLTELTRYDLTASQIAPRLGVSTRTVYRYRARLRETT